jgi:uncharacterized caspase-like protein
MSRASFLIRLAAAAAVSIAAGVAAAQDRLAFIVGNDSYRELSRLEKARGDAQAVANRLAQLGFKVDLFHDTDRRNFNAALAAFKAKVTAGAIVYFHFSGHGVELDGESFLLPADVPAPKDLNKDIIKSEALRLHEVVANLKETGAATRVLVIDACRDNPFATKFGRSIGSSRGLGAPAGAPAGTFIMFSAGAGQAALDKLSNQDLEPTSVYTRVLLKHLGQPGKHIAQVAQDVRAEVMELAKGVGHDQRPGYYDELTDKLVLAGGAALATPSLQPLPPVNQGVATPVDPQKDSRIALIPPVIDAGPAMVFADSNRRFLSAAEVAALAQRSPQLVNVAKNEIFARHGRRFVRGDLDAHFRRYPWYRPLTSDDAAITSRFNLFEKANVELLRRYER